MAKTMTTFLPFPVILFLAALQLQASNAVEFIVTNKAASTPGGIRFTNQIGIQYSKQTLISATNFIWGIFRQNSEADRKKNVQRVSLFIDNMEGVSYAGNNDVHVSADYIQAYSGDVKKEITGILYHEMTHIWQYWNENGQRVPEGLIEGIADFVRLKAGYPRGDWVQPGQGDRWDQGYDVTARFLEYCDGLRNGFVAELNKKMKAGYSDDIFVQLMGKTVDQLWSDYKARKYLSFQLICSAAGDDSRSTLE